MDVTDVTDAPRVLIVEDEDNIALALTTALGREGWRLSRVSDGAAAWEAIRAERPDLVILDVMLPHVSGYEICQRIRLDAGLADTRILMMTARGAAIERRKGLALGADAFVAKPFDLSDLMGQARRLLAGADEAPRPEAPAGPGAPDRALTAPASAPQTRPAGSVPVASAASAGRTPDATTPAGRPRGDETPASARPAEPAPDAGSAHGAASAPDPEDPPSAEATAPGGRRDD
ncbi:response regulator [Rhodovulum sp. 12E13]|nr:response regulator [Rhodovulum sp. 12E13]